MITVTLPLEEFERMRSAASEDQAVIARKELDDYRRDISALLANIIRVGRDDVNRVIRRHFDT